jgi:hypothetical protein
LKQQGEVHMSKLYRTIFFVFILHTIGSAKLCFALSLDQFTNPDADSSNKPCLIAEGQKEVDLSYGKNKEPEKTCWMYAGDAHKYLGYGTLLMAAAAGVSGGDNGFHKSAGVGAAVLGVAACASGFYAYDGYFDLKKGFTRRNIHIILGTLATAGFVAVAASAISNDDDSHAGLGIGSTALAAIPVIVLKF